MIEIHDKSKFDDIIDVEDLVVVDFNTKVCPTCRSIEKHLNKLETETGFKVYSVDANECSDLAVEYNIQSVPTIMIFENGININSHIGSITYDELFDMVR